MYYQYCSILKLCLLVGVFSFVLPISQVTGMKGDMQSMRHEMTLVHHVKDEMEDLRDVVDRMEDQCRQRKNHLLQQV